MARLKVFGGMLAYYGAVPFGCIMDKVQSRAVIAATSQKRAAALLGISLHEFRTHWAETGTLREVKAAMEKPETPLHRVYIPHYLSAAEIREAVGIK